MSDINKILSFASDSKSAKKSSKEAKYTLILYLCYFLWTIASAYGLGSSSPEEYSYILGFPAWFFFSCILAYPLCCIAVYFMLQNFFREDQDEENEEIEEGESKEKNLQ